MSMPNAIGQVNQIFSWSLLDSKIAGRMGEKPAVCLHVPVSCLQIMHPGSDSPSWACRTAATALSP